MGNIRKVLPVKLILGMISQKESLFKEAAKEFELRFGPIDFTSQVIPFVFTNYYKEEMGENLSRQFVSFKKLILPEKLVEIKLFSNQIEDRFSFQGKRRINLDPGYICEGKLILATTKDQQHRIYIGQGIFEEITLKYKDKTFQPWEWTYPDYRSKKYIEIFGEIRDIYVGQLKE